MRYQNDEPISPSKKPISAESFSRKACRTGVDGQVRLQWGSLRVFQDLIFWYIKRGKNLRSNRFVIGKHILMIFDVSQCLVTWIMSIYGTLFNRGSHLGLNFLVLCRPQKQKQTPKGLQNAGQNASLLQRFQLTMRVRKRNQISVMKYEFIIVCKDPEWHFFLFFRASPEKLTSFIGLCAGHLTQVTKGGNLPGDRLGNSSATTFLGCLRWNTADFQVSKWVGL